MREGRVIALAGLFQALALVRAIAQRGTCDEAAMRESLASVLRIDADTPADVFGGIGNVRLGLETLIAELGEEGMRDATMARMAVTVLRLERSLARRPDMRTKLRDEIEAIATMVARPQAVEIDLAARYARLYAETLSRLKPRVMVEGSHVYLDQPGKQNQIRALLLAAIRAVVLWRQLGGTQWRLLFRRKQYAMLARGLLARCMLDGS
ncbi:MAG TPA: high frequency lysogenization protein HflD [Rudaea sp.]|nr:high frequency lysogenization protein HflD [Rudaea sp.]